MEVLDPAHQDQDQVQVSPVLALLRAAVRVHGAVLAQGVVSVLARLLTIGKVTFLRRFHEIILPTAGGGLIRLCPVTL